MEGQIADKSSAPPLEGTWSREKNLNRRKIEDLGHLGLWKDRLQTSVLFLHTPKEINEGSKSRTERINSLPFRDEWRWVPARGRQADAECGPG